jgi:hypothetical protein
MSVSHNKNAGQHSLKVPVANKSFKNVPEFKYPVYLRMIEKNKIIFIQKKRVA